jgi:hypothetical protein
MVLLLCSSMIVVACSSNDANDNRLPTIAPTNTARAHATATFIPASSGVVLPRADWDNVDYMYAAMRPEYAADVDEFVYSRRYYIEATLTLGPENAVVQGAQRVRYTNTSPDVLTEIAYRLYPNIADMAGQLRVENLTLNGVAIEPIYENRGQVMSIPIAGGLQPRESVEMTMDFIMVVERGLLPDRFGFASQQFQAFNWHPALSVYDGKEHGWWKNRVYGNHWDPYYGAVGLYEFKITHDKKVLVGMSGVVINTSENADGSVTEHIVTGPMRDNFMVASPVMGKITDEVDGTRVNVLFMPGGERAAEWVMESGIRSLEIFNRIYGHYPYAELDIAQTETGAGGIEYPGIILVDTNFWQNGDPTTELITAHEVAHQWWYGMVGNNQDETPFLDESLASFSEGVYLREAYDDNDERYIAWFFLGSGGTDMTMFRAANDFPNAAYVGTLVYVKGRVFYGQLAEMLGWDTFYAGLNLYFHRMKYKITSPFLILRSFEDVSGIELDAYFREWVGNVTLYSLGG